MRLEGNGVLEEGLGGGSVGMNSTRETDAGKEKKERLYEADSKGVGEIKVHLVRRLNKWSRV